MKHMHRAVGLILSSVMALTLLIAPSAAAGNKLGTPTPFTQDNLGVVDTNRGNALKNNGYFTQNIEVNGVTRTAKVYIGSNAQLRCYFTVLNVPDGIDTTEFLDRSGWAALAERRGEGLFVLEPGEGGWGTYEQEQAYLTEAFKAYNTKDWYSNFSTSYLVGYGQGGSVLHAYAMANSMAMIGGVFVNASEIDGNYLQTIGSTPCGESDATYGEVPMPVWLINEEATAQNQAVVDYWKKANDCEADGAAQSDGSTLFNQRADSTSIVTSYSDARSKVQVLTGAVDIYNPEFTQRAYEFMCGYTRYETAVLAGNALGYRPDYQKMGLEIHEFELDGLIREYILYIPEKVKNSGEKAPMVMIMGGSNQPNRIFFDASHWWEIADEEGLIILSPCSWASALRWNNTGDPTQRDDLKFIQTVLDEVIANNPVDPTRIYSTGQSNGAVMTEFLAQQIPERFAAVAASSGGLIEQALYAEDNGKAIIPTYVLFGEKDLWNYDYAVEGEVRTLVKYFTARNSASNVDTPDSKTVDGRFTTYGWKNGNGVTMVQLTQTQGRPHNCIPTEMRLEWEWFKQWSRGTDGTLYHNGTPVNASSSNNPGQDPTDPEVSQYTVVKGDTLWGIAKRFYQNGSKYTKIVEANKDKISNPNVIKIGQTLNIPKL